MGSVLISPWLPGWPAGSDRHRLDARPEEGQQFAVAIDEVLAEIPSRKHAGGFLELGVDGGLPRTLLDLELRQTGKVVL